jgi:cytochrome oxidase Cu insertion factor (SCO1/SenC/PrrC family)
LTYWDVAIVVVTVLGIINLFWIVTIAHHLNAHLIQKSWDGPTPLDDPVNALPVGAELPEFSAIDISGQSISFDELRGAPHIFAFFAASCQSCRHHVARVIEFMQGEGKGAGLVVVVSGDVRRGADLVEALKAWGRVIVEEPVRGALVEAFSVWAFPLFYITDSSGKIVSNGIRLPRTLSSTATFSR